jgi:hypothetical protein
MQPDSRRGVPPTYFLSRYDTKALPAQELSRLNREVLVCVKPGFRPPTAEIENLVNLSLRRWIFLW